MINPEGPCKPAYRSWIMSYAVKQGDEDQVCVKDNPSGCCVEGRTVDGNWTDS